MLNPSSKIAKSEGIDLPIMYVYLAGRIAGNCIEKCLEWREQIITHYRHYKPVYGRVYEGANDEVGKQMIVSYDSYPIAFLSPLNSGEAKSVDKQGLTSSIPPNMIYDKDLLSVEKADCIVANMDDFFESGIEVELSLTDAPVGMYKEAYEKLREKILHRRENLGTICEVAWSLYLQKPLILIVPERREETFQKHPFMRRASAIVTSVDQLIEEKHLNILYKSIAGATYA
jgi:nucleoside 2-deoxyribosyltransferase